MNFRTFMVGAMALSLAGCFDNCDKTSQAPAPDNTEVKILGAQLTQAQTELADTKRRLETAESGRLSAYDRVTEERKEQQLLVATAFNPKSAKSFATALDKKVMQTGSDREMRFVQNVHLSMSETFGSLGSDAFNAVVKTMMDYPAFRSAVYTLVKPHITTVVGHSMLDYGSAVIKPIIGKDYDPYIGLLAATQGHSCRWELGVTDGGSKTDVCTKVFKTIENHYGAISPNLIEVLGVMHRRYDADDSAGHEGFKDLMRWGKELVEEAMGRKS